MNTIRHNPTSTSVKQARKEHKKIGKRKLRSMKRAGMSYQQVGEFISRFRREL